MSEQDLRDCMQQAVWDEPPLDFDPDSFMARAEQLTKRRRALMSVGVATALIIATVATLPAFFTAGRGRVDAANTVTATTNVPTSVNFPWPPNNAARKNHTYEEDQPYLESMWVNFLSPALQRQGVAPSTIGTWSPTYQRTGFERDGAVSDVLFGVVSYADTTGPSQLATTIAGVGAWEPSPDQLCAKFESNESTCDVVKMLDGSVVVAMETSGAKTAKTANDAYYSGERTAYHYRLDGSMVAMTSRAQFLDTNTYENGYIPLTLDQLTDMATNPAIKLEH